MTSKQCEKKQKQVHTCIAIERERNTDVNGERFRLPSRQIQSEQTWGSGVPFPAVPNRCRLTAASPQDAHSKHARDPVKVHVSKSIPEKRVHEACQPPTWMSFSAHSSWGRAVCTSDSSSKQDNRRRNAAWTRHSVRAQDNLEPSVWNADMQHAHGSLASTHRYPFSAFPLLWKDAFGMCAASQVTTFKATEANPTYYNKMTKRKIFYPEDPCGKKEVCVELHELLGSGGHGYRLNSCAPNTGFSEAGSTVVVGSVHGHSWPHQRPPLCEVRKREGMVSASQRTVCS